MKSSFWNTLFFWSSNWCPWETIISLVGKQLLGCLRRLESGFKCVPGVKTYYFDIHIEYSTVSYSEIHLFMREGCNTQHFISLHQVLTLQNYFLYHKNYVLQTIWVCMHQDAYCLGRLWSLQNCISSRSLCWTSKNIMIKKPKLTFYKV